MSHPPQPPMAVAQTTATSSGHWPVVASVLCKQRVTEFLLNAKQKNICMFSDKWLD